MPAGLADRTDIHHPGGAAESGQKWHPSDGHREPHRAGERRPLCARSLVRMAARHAHVSPRCAPRGAARRGAAHAGLAAWLFASVCLLLMTTTVPMLLDYFDDDLARMMFGYVGAVAVPAGLVFAGTRLGLPRDLVRLHGWRLLGASLAAMASTSVVFFGGAVAWRHAGAGVLSGTMAIVVLGSAFVACWVWFRVFYASVSRDTVETRRACRRRSFRLSRASRLRGRIESEP